MNNRTACIWSVATALLLGGVGSAAAIPQLELLKYGKALQELKKDPHMDDARIADCRKDMQKAMGEIEPDEPARALFGEFDGLAKATRGDGDYLYLAGKDALSICDEIEKYEPYRKAMPALDKAQGAAALIAEIVAEGDRAVDAYFNDAHLQLFTEAEQGCRPAFAVLAKGPYKTVELGQRYPYAKVEPATGEKVFCDGLTTALASYKKAREAREAANKAAWEEVAKPLRKAGLSGEKLDYFISAEGIAVYGKGGKELTTPKQKAAAKVTFEVLTGDDGRVTVKRQQWKGNKAAGWSNRDYLTRPGPSAFR